MTVKACLLSFPERLVRSALGLGAGVAREVGEVALPAGIRHSQLYQNEIRKVGYLTSAGRQFRPHVRAAVDQFSPKRRTLTHHLLDKL